MTLFEMKEKILTLVEELDPQSVFLTEDPQMAAKLCHVIDQVQLELARMKKLPRFLELPVQAGELVDFAAISRVCGARVYQLGTVTGVNCIHRAEGTVLQMLESGVARIECYVYPSRITGQTEDGFLLELSEDCQQILPYGAAADLLKSDPAANYGKVYADRYETMLRRLDPRYRLGSISVEGGVAV